MSSKTAAERVHVKGMDSARTGPLMKDTPPLILFARHIESAVNSGTPGPLAGATAGWLNRSAIRALTELPFGMGRRVSVTFDAKPVVNAPKLCKQCANDITLPTSLDDEMCRMCHKAPAHAICNSTTIGFPTAPSAR